MYTQELKLEDNQIAAIVDAETGEILKTPKKDLKISPMVNLFIIGKKNSIKVMSEQTMFY